MKMKYLRKFEQVDDSIHNINIDTTNKRINVSSTESSKMDKYQYHQISDDIDKVKYQLENGMDPDLGSDFPLRDAITKGRLDIVKLLLKYTDVHNKRNVFTKVASERKKFDILHFFVDLGGVYIEDFEQNMAWVVSSSRLNKDEKIEVLNRLQKYVDSGKVNLGGSYSDDGKIITLDEVVKKYGKLANFFIKKIKDTRFYTGEPK